MTGAEAVKIVAGLAAAYPTFTLAEATVRIYAHDLGGQDVGVATKAAERLRRTSRFFPTISELLRECAEVALGAPPLMQAYMEASGPLPRHPLVNQARRLVGDDWDWRTSNTYELRREFQKAYREVHDVAIAELGAGPDALEEAS